MPRRAWVLKIRQPPNCTTTSFVRIHQMIKITLAMAAGVTSGLWEMFDMVAVLERWEASRG